jgi:hypothetical protein
LPDLTLPDVRGGAFHLRALPAQPLLLAFLQTVPDTADTPSRNQVVFLASMAQQYGPRGLRVAIVDASVFVPGSQPSHDAVLNASYDWHLQFPLLLDRNGQLARQLGVKEVPTTFLIAIDGTIVQRWQGRTLPRFLPRGSRDCWAARSDKCLDSPARSRYWPLSWTVALSGNSRDDGPAQTL